MDINMADNEERNEGATERAEDITEETAAEELESAAEDIEAAAEDDEYEITPEDYLPKKKRGKKGLVIFLLIVVLIGLGVLGVIYQNDQLQKSFYQVKNSKLTNNIRIVCLSDMHLKEFGENNERLVYEISKLQPDLITLVGDMMNESTPDDYECVITLCKELEEIAPLYYSLGNHELDAMLFGGSQIYKDAKKEGINILNNESAQITIGNTTLDIIGLSQRPDGYERYGQEFFEKAIYADDNFKLVLTHYPENFMGTLDDYPIDLALSGHAHGGQIRLPWIGGLYSADQGFLPELCDGYHEIGNSTLLITRGLGTSGYIPRINNIAEILVADLGWY